MNNLTAEPVRTLCIERRIEVPPMVAVASWDRLPASLAIVAAPARGRRHSQPAALRLGVPATRRGPLRRCDGTLVAGRRSVPVEADLAAWDDASAVLALRPRGRSVPLGESARQRWWWRHGTAALDHLAQRITTLVVMWLYEEMAELEIRTGRRVPVTRLVSPAYS